MAEQSSAAFFSLTQAEYAAGNFRSKVLENNMTATVRVTSRTDNVAGVKLPVFGQYNTGVEVNDNLGLVGGGRKITVCREKFNDYLQALIKIASLQTSFIAMDEALKITNRRVNALENVTLPKIIDTISYINRELDELEREDFTRLKMVKKKKEEQAKLDELEEEAYAKELVTKANEVSNAPAVPSKAAPPVPPSAPVVEADSNNQSKNKKKNKKNKNKKENSTASLLEGDEEEHDEDVVFT